MRAQFQNHYQDPKISKEDIFHYVYGVLHCPTYRKTYEHNLKRDFPRIPYYKDFALWSEKGKKLMSLHIGFEDVKPYPLKRTDQELSYAPRPKLKADKDLGQIQIDEQSLLSGIPEEAWAYKLGNRSALEWVLDQYKEKTIKDPTIKERFDAYKFADHKEDVIALLGRVCRVSVETVKLVKD